MRPMQAKAALPGPHPTPCIHTGQKLAAWRHAVSLAGDRKPCRQLQVVSASKRQMLVAHPTWLRNGGADAPDSPFAVLRLTEDGLAGVGGAVKRRRYSGLGSHEAPSVQWGDVYMDPTRPLLVDVGCGAGRFVLLAAHYSVIPTSAGQAAPSCAWAGQSGNFLGLDQHSTLMSRANHWARARGLAGHCHFLSVNAKANLHSLLASYPGPIALLSVQYPDPHYRQERHVVTQDFVSTCTSVLPPGSSVLLTSDVKSTAAHMRDMFAMHAAQSFALHPLHSVPGATQPDDGVEVDPYLPPDRATSQHSGTPCQLAPAVQVDGVTTDTLTASALHMSSHGTAVTKTVLSTAWSDSGWLVENPLGDIPTEREVFARTVTLSPVFRVLLQRV